MTSSATTPQRLEIREAAAHEQERVLALRYQVYCGELSDYRHRVDGQRHQDQLDLSGASRTLVCVSQGSIVGALRLTPRTSSVKFLREQNYAFSRLAQAMRLGDSQLLARVSLIDRGVVAKPYRGGGIFRQLHRRAEAHSRALGRDLMVCVVLHRGGRPDLRDFYLASGWTPYITHADADFESTVFISIALEPLSEG